MRKVDFRLMTLVISLYTMTFLDRVNLGNARLWNMETDLNMTGYDFNLVLWSNGFPLRPALLTVADRNDLLHSPYHLRGSIKHDPQQSSPQVLSFRPSDVLGS